MNRADINIRSANDTIASDTSTSRLSSAMWGTFGVLAVLGLVTPNPWLTLATMLVPPFLFWLLWRPGQPPILAFAAAFQWLQTSCPVLAADAEWRPVSDQPYGSYLEKAAWLSLIAVTILGVGMSVSLRRMKPINHDAVRTLSRRLSSERLFVAYIVSLFLSTAFTWVAIRTGSLRQPILALAAIKWIPLFLLCWSTLQCRKPKKLMLTAVGIEIMIGFASYFSSFKSVLFLLLIITAGTASDRQHLPKSGLVLVTTITLLLVSFWQAVKVDYRNYLNQGTGQQVVLVPFEQRMTFLARSASQVTPERMVDGMLDGIKRLGYIHFFAHTIRNVPNSIPHQNGELWTGAVKHVFMPRVLFPDKPVVQDSERTNRFTGLRVAGEKQGTSISIGYIGESYIDFGVYLMMVPVFLLGYLYGWIYTFFVSRDATHLVGFAIACSILLFSAILVESSNVKLVGGVTTALLAFSFLQWFFQDQLLQKVMN